MTFSTLYGNAMLMGMGPRDVDCCSLWEFLAIADHWQRAHSREADDPPAVTSDDFDDMKRRNADFIAQGVADHG